MAKMYSGKRKDAIQRCDVYQNTVIFCSECRINKAGT